MFTNKFYFKFYIQFPNKMKFKKLYSAHNTIYLTEKENTATQEKSPINIQGKAFCFSNYPIQIGKRKAICYLAME